jgi:cytochrome c biogenesis protein CcmG, thiol:disulfide interchange protein DsbE
VTARRQWQIVIGVVLALGLGLWAATRFLGDEIFPVTVGSRAPDFAAATLDATPQPRTLARDYKGKVVLVNIWATWCAPCRHEMPSMQALYEDFAPRGFEIVAVSVDDAGAEQKVRDFAKEFGLTFDILHDPSGSIQQVYQTTGVPENFLIAADGTIRKKAYAQDWNSETNRALIAQLLDEAGAPPAASATPRRSSPASLGVDRMQVEVVPESAAPAPPRATPPGGARP